MFSEKSTACIAQSAERNDTYLGLQNDAGTADGHRDVRVVDEVDEAENNFFVELVAALIFRLHVIEMEGDNVLEAERGGFDVVDLGGETIMGEGGFDIAAEMARGGMRFYVGVPRTSRCPGDDSALSDVRF